MLRRDLFKLGTEAAGRIPTGGFEPRDTVEPDNEWVRETILCICKEPYIINGCISDLKYINDSHTFQYQGVRI